MKLKYILQTFFIALLAIVACACDETIDDSLLEEWESRNAEETEDNAEDESANDKTDNVSFSDHDLWITSQNNNASDKYKVSSISLPRSGGSKTYYVYANHSSTSWQIINVPSWLTVSPTSGTTGFNAYFTETTFTEVTFTANDNESSIKDRVATIILKGSFSDGKEVESEITLSQLGLDTYFEITESTKSTWLSGEAQSQTYTVKTNMQEVELSTNKSWLSASYNASDKTLTISVSENPSSTYRQGSITVKEKGNINDTKTFTVYQYGK
jgi:hypothetical protein